MTNLFPLTASLLVLIGGFTVFYGYGKFFAEKVLQMRGLGLGHFACIGYALFLCFCGYLEIFRLGSALFFFIFSLVGLGCAISLTKMSSLNSLCNRVIEYVGTLSKVKIGLFYLAIGLIVGFILTYLINLSAYPFNDGDDLQGYLVLSRRILDEGYQGGDVFNLRAIVQGFGGGNYINAFFLQWMPLRFIHIAEGGLGLFLLLALTSAYVRVEKNGVWQLIGGMVCICIFAIFIPIVNITPILSAAALAFGILLLAQKTQANSNFKIAFLLGLYAAGLTLLKGTLLVPAIIFCAVYYMSRMIQLQKWSVVIEAFVTLMSFLLLLTPWALINYYYFNTLFYPLLGSGLVTSGGFGLVSSDIFLDNLYQYHPLYLLVLATWFLFICYEKSPTKIIFSHVLLAVLFVTTLLLAITPGGSFRYNFVLLTIPSIFFITSYLAIDEKNFKSPTGIISQVNTKRFLILVLIVSFSLLGNQVKRVGRHLFEMGLYSRFIHIEYQSLKLNDPLSSHFSNRETIYQDLQNTIPIKATALVVVDEPYRFDFSRNRLFVADIPGTTGFKPGVPFQGNSLDLANYLLANQIRYVVHTYKGWDEINDFDEMHSKIEWVRNQVIRFFAVNKQLLGLSKFYQPVLDNGSERVFDLCDQSHKAFLVCGN